jgi:hypothetical protein
LTSQSSTGYLPVIEPVKKEGFGDMTIVRRIIAAAAVAGTLSLLPISVITTDTQSAGRTVGTVSTCGQGNWPLKA